MACISSKMTFFYKRIFPVLWFGFLAVFIAIALFTGMGAQQSSVLPFLIIPAVMIVIGYKMMKKLCFDLADEVLDAGDALIVRNGGQEERIALSEVKNVNYSPFISPPRVTLSLRRRTVFGDQVAFCAPVRVVPFSSSPVIDDLIERIDAARQKR